MTYQDPAIIWRASEAMKSGVFRGLPSNHCVSPEILFTHLKGSPNCMEKATTAIYWNQGY